MFLTFFDFNSNSYPYPSPQPSPAKKNQYTIQTPFAGEGVDRGKP
jgi:hypothetical protein